MLFFVFVLVALGYAVCWVQVQRNMCYAH